MSATLAFVTAAPARSYAEGEDPFLFRRGRTWWLLLALVLMAQENANIFSAASTASEKLKTLRQFYAPSTPILLLFTVLLWTICTGLMVKEVGPILRLMLNQKAVLVFAFLAFLSTLWSQDPELTFRKAVLLFLSCAFAWFFATSYTPSDQMRLLLAAGVILALASITWAVLLPQYGLDSGGEWRGVLGQKNQLGHATLFLFSGLVFRPISSGRQLRKIIALAMLPIGLIVLSQSRGSLLLALLLVAVRVYGPFLKSRRRDQLPFALYASFTAIVAITLGWNILLFLLGRDSTLTGRTHEWSIISPYVFQHLWFGYGYQAFWTGTGDSLRAITRIGGGIRGSDSGYLDTMLQFGLMGMLLWLTVMLVILKDFVRLFHRSFVPLAGYWYAGVVLVTFVGSFADGFFPGPIGIGTFTFVVACAGLRMLSSENRALARAANETSQLPAGDAAI
jgi:exopolysaccharide production protein ExoQ